MLSRFIDPGAVVVPEPVVPGAILVVPRSGVPLVFPLWPAAAGSVGDGVVGLTLGPDWFAGAGALCAKAVAAGSVAINAATARLRTNILSSLGFPVVEANVSHSQIVPAKTNSRGGLMHDGCMVRYVDQSQNRCSFSDCEAAMIPISHGPSKNCGDDHYYGSSGHNPSCAPTHASQNALNEEPSHNFFV